MDDVKSGLDSNGCSMNGIKNYMDDAISGMKNFRGNMDFIRSDMDDTDKEHKLH